VLIKHSFLEKVRELLIEHRVNSLRKPPTNMPIWLGKGAKGEPFPKGIKIQEKKPNFVIFIFDESASVSDKMLSLFKSLASSICTNEKLYGLTVSMTYGIDSAKVEVITPRDTSALSKRSLSGATGEFHKVTTNFDKILEKEGKNIEKQLKEKSANVSLGEIKKAFEEGRIAGIIFTDGIIYDHLESEDLEKLKEYSRKRKKPSLLFVVPKSLEVTPSRIFSNIDTATFNEIATLYPVNDELIS